MIRDGAITYGTRNGSFSSWRFSDEVLNELAIAVLLTILSYQAAETVINLSFGIKGQGEAKLRDIQIMLLIRKSSPVTVARSFFPNKLRGLEKDVTKTYLDEDLPHAKEKDTALYPCVYTKLFLLLLAVPLINIVTVGMTLERETVLTFADAEFGGLAFGLDMNRSIEKWSQLSSLPSSSCESTILETNAAEIPVAEFYSCIVQMEKQDSPQIDRNVNISVIVKRVKSEPVFITVSIGSNRVTYSKRVMVLSLQANSSRFDGNRRLYYLENILSLEEAGLLAEHGLALAQAHCDYVEGGIKKQKQVRKKKGHWALSRRLMCIRASARTEEDIVTATKVARQTLKAISFVNSDDLRIRDDDEEDEEELLEEKFESGDNLLLFKRRRGYVSIPLLAIFALGAMSLRMLSELLTKNDLERGIGLIVRDGLGLPCCDSMLCSSDVVARYNSRGSILYGVDRGHSNLRV